MQYIGKQCHISPEATINVDDLFIGDFSTIRGGAVIEGKHVFLGKENYIGKDAVIGGGRKELGSFDAGDFLYLGERCFVNTAHPVIFGNEVVIALDSKLFTHGAGLSQWNGHTYVEGPIEIGNRVWIGSGCIIQPNVAIGDDVEIISMSQVYRDIPSGHQAGGNPARVLSPEPQFPKILSSKEKLAILDSIVSELRSYNIEAKYNLKINEESLIVGDTTFFISERKIVGYVNKETEQAKEILRRHGIRFRYYKGEERWLPWD